MRTLGLLGWALRLLGGRRGPRLPRISRVPTPRRLARRAAYRAARHVISNAVRDSRPVARSPATEQPFDGGDGVVVVDADPGPEPDPYFATMGDMLEAIAQRRFDVAAPLVRRNVEELPAFVERTVRESGSFDITSLPSVHRGGVVLAVRGDEAGLARMLAVVSSVPRLHPWRDEVLRHRESADLCRRIRKAVSENPGCLQPGVKQLIGIRDGRRVANLLSWLEKAGEITRRRSGKSWRVYRTADAPPPETSERSEREPPPSHRRGARPITVVRLPGRVRSAVVLSEPGIALSAGRETSANGASAHFETMTSDWRIEEERGLPLRERPDPAFRRPFATRSGVFWVDDRGKAARFPGAPAAALLHDGSGGSAIRRPLLHGIWRVAASPMGGGLIAISRRRVVHAYDEALRPILETGLDDSPETLALASRLSVGPNERLPKNYFRAAALSPRADRYVVTACDEAWCYDVDGGAVWGVRMPAPPRASVTDISGFSIEMSGGPYAQDWIDSAAFAGDGRSVWLASYSGRLVCVSPSGRPKREFCGSRGAGEILELGHATLAALGGRMVVLEGSRCAAAFELPGSGQIVATDAGLLVLEAKGIRWFGMDGRFRGGLAARAPVRRIYEADGATIVETRMRRARITGAPPWWHQAGPQL